MSNQNECLLEQLAENKNYKGLIDYRYYTEKEIDDWKNRMKLQKVLDAATSNKSESKRQQDFIDALCEF